MDSNNDESEGAPSAAEQTAQAEFRKQDAQRLWSSKVLQAALNTGYNIFDFNEDDDESIAYPSVGSMIAESLTPPKRTQATMYEEDTSKRGMVPRQPPFRSLSTPHAPVRKETSNAINNAAVPARRERQRSSGDTWSAASSHGWFPPIEPDLFSELTPFFEREVSPIPSFATATPTPDEPEAATTTTKPVSSTKKAMPIPQDIRDLAEHIGTLKQLNGFPTRVALRSDVRLKGEFVPKTGLMRTEDKGSKLRAWFGDVRLFDMKTWNYLVERQ